MRNLFLNIKDTLSLLKQKAYTMKFSYLLAFTASLLLFSNNNLLAQCGPTEVSVTMAISTDRFAYEGYWEIVPAGNTCGVGTIVSGGNNLVGCNGGDARTATAGNGYANDAQINVPAFCLTTDMEYQLIYVDDYGDAGFEFEILIEGYTTANFSPMIGGYLTLNFFASPPPAVDAGLHGITSPYVNDDEGSREVKGILFNYGQNTITSLEINYQVDNGTVYTDSKENLNISNFENYQFTHATNWNATIGNHVMKMWVSNINGTQDLNNTNDTLYKEIEINQGIPNIIDGYLTLTPSFNTIVTSANSLDKPTDLDFHPILSNKQLWVINKKTEASGGSTVIVNNAGESNQTSIMRKDQNSWHFMSLPTGIAFSKNGNFATSPGVYDANHNGGEPFTGPALWSSDLDVYAQPSGGNGSHLDMLHSSPYSQGIASEADNVFWLFDGYHNDIVRYDFVNDHGPGNSYHDDGMVHRYRETTVSKDPNNKIVSHLAISDGWVYVVDHGNQRVFRIEMGTGVKGATPNFGQFETLAEYKEITGYTMEPVVTTGLDKPAGIDIIENRMIVSDYATGDIIVYDITTMPALELGRINTGAQGIMGVKIGPEGRIWYVDYDSNTAVRVEPSTIGISESNLQANFSVAPNPANQNLNVSYTGNVSNTVQVRLIDVTGKIVLVDTFKSSHHTINTQQMPNGMYQLIVTTNNQSASEKIIIQH
jgi:hypothetical protein